MVSSEQENIVWTLNFQTKEIRGNFRSVVASVNVVTQEQHLLLSLVGTMSLLQFTEHCHKVIELAMDVSTNDNFTIDSH